jgi:hypothetical protein
MFTPVQTGADIRPESGDAVKTRAWRRRCRSMRSGTRDSPLVRSPDAGSSFRQIAPPEEFLADADRTHVIGGTMPIRTVPFAVAAIVAVMFVVSPLVSAQSSGEYYVFGPGSFTTRYPAVALFQVSHWPWGAALNEGTEVEPIMVPVDIPAGASINEIGVHGLNGSGDPSLWLTVWLVRLVETASGTELVAAFDAGTSPGRFELGHPVNDAQVTIDQPYFVWITASKPWPPNGQLQVTGGWVRYETPDTIETAHR